MSEYKNTLLYILLSIISLCTLFGQLNCIALAFICKPLPILYLLFLVFNTKFYSNTNKYLLLTAISCSIFGDLLLIVDKYFIYGLVAFIGAHLAYLSLFYSNIREPKLSRYLLIIPIIVCAISLGLYLSAYVSITLKLYIYIYIFILSLMSFSAALTTQKYNLIFFGSLFFMLADSLLAINVFISYSIAIHVISLCCYYMAQALLIKGSLLIYQEK